MQAAVSAHSAQVDPLSLDAAELREEQVRTPDKIPVSMPSPLRPSGRLWLARAGRAGLILSVVVGLHLALLLRLLYHQTPPWMPQAPKPIMVSLIRPAQPLATPTPEPAPLLAASSSAQATPKPKPPMPVVKPALRPKPRTKKVSPPMQAVKRLPVLSSATSSSVTKPVQAAEPSPALRTSSTAPATAPMMAAPPASGPVAEPTSPKFSAAYLHNPPPEYPLLSRRLGEEGKVLLRVLVNTDGRAEQIALEKSSGFSRLDQAAQKAVKDWLFVPAKLGDRPVSGWVIVPIVFTLEG